MNSNLFNYADEQAWADWAEATPPVRISDQIEVLAGSRTSRFHHLGTMLIERGHYDAALMVEDWTFSVSRGQYRAMVNLWADWAAEEGVIVLRSVTSPLFLQARDQWCLDYAEFLREFGL